MMWFVIVPPWLFFLACFIGVLVGIWELVEDADCKRDARLRRENKVPALQELSDRLDAALARKMP
jgi:hypothetical protein